MNKNVMSDLESYFYSNPKFNSRIPTYNDSSDYTTNAPSYYDDLARKNKLMKVLALRIWEYEEEMIRRLEQWDKNLEDFPDDVKKLLEKWLEDGTLDHIINETIFSWKADKTYVDTELGKKADITYVDSELDKKADITYVDSEVVNLKNEVYEITDDVSKDLDGRGLNIKRHYNVIGDGVNDDSILINQAIQENDYIYVPSGVYALYRTVNVPVNKKIDISEDALFLIKGDFNGFEIHSKAEITNLRIEIDDDNYDSTAVVIYNEGEEDPQLRGGIKKLRVVNKNTTYKGNGVELKPSHNSGIAWTVNYDWFVDGFKNAIYFNSNDGWINSNVFENIGIYRSTNIIYMPTPELMDNANGEISANEIINLHIQSHHVHDRSILMGNSSRYNKVSLMVWDWQANHPDGGIDIELQTGSAYNIIEDRSHFESRFLNEGNNNVSGRNHNNSTKLYNVRGLTSEGIVRSTRMVDNDLFETFIDANSNGAYMYFRKNQSDIVGSVSIDNDGVVLLNGKKALIGETLSIPIDVVVPVNDVLELVLDAPGVRWRDSVSVGATYSLKERPKVLFSAFVSANDKITVRFLNMNDEPSYLRDTYNFNVIKGA